MRRVQDDEAGLEETAAWLRKVYPAGAHAVSATTHGATIDRQATMYHSCARRFGFWKLCGRLASS